MYFDCIMAGFGGQGILSAGMMLANMAVAEDLNVTWFPSYGAEQRGGTANCSVVISDSEIGSPVVSSPMYGFIMNEPSLDKFQPRVKSGASVIIDSSLVNPERASRTDIDFYTVSATAAANELGSAKIANMIMIGALLKVSELFPLDVATRALGQVISKKYAHLIPLNEAALTAGFSAVEKLTVVG